MRDLVAGTRLPQHLPQRCRNHFNVLRVTPKSNQDKSQKLDSQSDHAPPHMKPSENNVHIPHHNLQLIHTQSSEQPVALLTYNNTQTSRLTC